MSHFDASQMVRTLRTEREAGRNAIIDSGRDGPWGPVGGGLAAVWDIVMSDAKRVGVWYSTGAGNEQRIFQYSGLPSGLLNTLLWNSLVNRAMFKQGKDKLMENPDMRNMVYLKSAWFLGDDAQQVWAVTRPKSWTEMHARFLSETFIDQAKLNNFDINFLKTVNRFGYSEFLKKKTCWGRLLPLRIVQHVASENSHFDVWPVTWAMSHASTLETVWSRGDSEIFCRRLLMYMFSFKRSLKMIRTESKVVGHAECGTKFNLQGVVQRYYLPMGALWLPTELKGAGQLPYAQVIASKSGIIANDCFENPSVRKYLNECAMIMKVPTSTLKKRVAKQIMQGKDVETVLDRGGEEVVMPGMPFKHGLNWMSSSLQSDRIEASEKAATALANVGVYEPDLMYKNSPTVAVRKAIEDDPHIQDIELAQRLISGVRYRQAAVKLIEMNYDAPDAIGAMFGWLEGFSFAEGEELPPVKIEPAGAGFQSPDPCMTETMREIQRRIGFDTGGDPLELRPSTLLSELRRDPFFPRNLDEETIVAFISKWEVISDPNRVYDALVMLGASRDSAAKIATKAQAGIEAFSFRKNAQAFSYGDASMGKLDLSLKSHQRVVSMVDIVDTPLRNLLWDLGMGVTVSRAYKTGRVSRTVIDIRNGAAVSDGIKRLRGRTVKDSTLLILRDIYGRRKDEVLG
jgi:hypothetical protein